MEEFIQGLVKKVGLSEEKAKEVVEFIKSNADKIPELLKSTGIADKLPKGLGGLLGG